MVIAFWNINNNTDLGDVLVDFVKENDVDILLLAESDKNPKNKRTVTVDDIILDFLSKIRYQQQNRAWNEIKNSDFRVKAISSLDQSVFRLEKDIDKGGIIQSSRWSIFSIEISGRIKFNLFPVHFHSRKDYSEFSLALECVNFAMDIKKVEEKTKCENSILIGDFNMNPFEYGMVAANGINATRDLNYLKQKSHLKVVDNVKYTYFYNPMWNFLSNNDVPYGTMFYPAPGHISLGWNIYDQILLRPGLLSYVSNDSIKIITEISGQSILKKFDRPNEDYSDHLPILLDIKI